MKFANFSKALLRNTELAATERHLDRLREGRPETIETTSLHLDVLRDLRRIHSHISSVAYPVLDAAGELSANQNAESDLVAIPNQQNFHQPGDKLENRHETSLCGLTGSS
jgi:hypothetical protein